MWDELAPYWEFFELKNFNPTVLENYVQEIKSPLLLIGAGQGLVTEPLRARGLKVIGIDWSFKMVARGLQRRGEPNIVADALSLPFKEKSFASVLVATGTLDFMFEKERQLRALHEAKRVLSDARGLLLNFTRPLEKEMIEAAKQFGIVSEDVIHAERAFEIWKFGSNPSAWEELIKKWKGLNNNQAREIVQSGHAALEYLAHSLESINRPIADYLERQGLKAQEAMKVLEASLSPLPLWTEERIRALLQEAGWSDCEIRILPEVYVVIC